MLQGFGSPVAARGGWREALQAVGCRISSESGGCFRAVKFAWRSAVAAAALHKSTQAVIASVLHAASNAWLSSHYLPPVAVGGGRYLASWFPLLL